MFLYYNNMNKLEISYILSNNCLSNKDNQNKDNKNKEQRILNSEDIKNGMNMFIKHKDKENKSYLYVNNKLKYILIIYMLKLTKIISGGSSYTTTANNPNIDDKKLSIQSTPTVGERKIVGTTGAKIEEHDDELVTSGLIACMAIFWHFNDKNYLIHHSERQANVKYHPMVIVNEYIKKHNMTHLTIYVYSALGFFDHEKEYFSDCFSDHTIEYKAYNPISPNDEFEIGLTKDGYLIDNIEPMK